MAKILNWHTVRERLREKNIVIFAPKDLSRLFGVSPVAANFFTFRNAKKGWLLRLKKSPKGSLYCLADNPPSPYLIANRLYEPSYISFDTALAFHNLIPETVYAMTSATTRATRTFTANQISYIYSKVKSGVYTGYRLVRYLNEPVLIAEPEKALADLLYFVDLKKRRLHYERLNLADIDRKKLMRYAALFSRPSMLKLAEGLYAHQRKHPRIV